jgi:spore maturation protein CgeB
MIKVFSRSRINLGFNTCGDTFSDADPIRQVRLRDFEIPMSGGFYLTEAFEELADFYEPGKEVVFFSSPEECADKAEYYLKHGKEREAIRKAGYRRAQQDHTWQKRLSAAFQEMNMPFKKK